MPEAVAALVIDGGVGSTVMTKVPNPVPPALLALMLTLVVPVALGVPVMAPLLVLTLRPAGNPLALKLVGVLLAAIVQLKAEPLVPVAVSALVIDGGVGKTVMTNVAEPVPPALIALMLALVVPVAVGVPVMAPLLVFTFKPEGSPLAL